MLLTHTTPTEDETSSLSEVLNRHLSACPAGDSASIAGYIDHGAALIDADALRALEKLTRPLEAKIAQIDHSPYLQRRLDLLATYCCEAMYDGSMGSPAHREAAFALLYFLKGADRVPDSVPEVGLLDDALIVQTVLQRRSAALRAHWLRRRRWWPAEF